MSMNYAVIEDGVVVNIIVWDGESPIDSSLEVVNIPDGVACNIGYLFADGVFTAPPRDPADIIQENTFLKQNLLFNANRMVSELTDATDPDIMGDDIDPADVELLKQWKAYRVKLNKVTDMLNPIWPTMPGA